MMTRTRRLIVLLGILPFVCTTASRAADPPAKPAAAANPRGPVIPAAVAALAKEYQAHEKDPKAKVRTKSDYFKSNPSPDATPDAIMRALESSVSGGPAVEAYVKWQLLSAHPEKFRDDLVKRAIAVYRRAPGFVVHPGLNHKAMNRAVMTKKKGDVPGIQKQLDAAVAANNEANFVFAAYRDALYARLPATPDALSAGIEDVATRASSGVPASAAYDAVATGIRGWAVAGATPAQARSLASAVARLAQVAADEDNRPFTKLGDDVKWKATPAVDPKKAEELAKFLNDIATPSSGGGGGLKFKGSK